MAGRPSIPNGYEQIAVSSAVKSLTPPNATTGGIPHYALIRTDQDIRWRDDGTNPSASVGMVLKANEVLLYDGKMQTLRLIRVSADATVDVSYYKFGSNA